MSDDEKGYTFDDAHLTARERQMVVAISDMYYAFCTELERLRALVEAVAGVTDDDAGRDRIAGASNKAIRQTVAFINSRFPDIGAAVVPQSPKDRVE